MFFIFFVFLFLSVMFLLGCLDAWSDNMGVPVFTIVWTSLLITATCFLGVYSFG